ncbi:hypothetical protein EPD60_14210 [Flaviaesturariibacter flavus]|uniref:Uncharacterized protein n=1 Tax=Flaviaesturariibacter flavus TaxID=2502780 RepID=A0A4V2NV76_9BACT|nr:hypothetical protein [Flaviaesturariibacter flavus]TCJ12426.1 hypothetical protein EPD60_14210 [Flaviaesturariibacter flavus]
MRNDSANPYDDANRSRDSRPASDDRREGSDIRDNSHDRERLKPDEGTIELPDVKDIPGQEFVNAPPLGMLGDTTISSADEEGEGIFDDDEEDETDIVMGTEADVSTEEKEVLARSETYLPTHDEDRLQQAAMDNTDFDGEPLNEASFGAEQSGEDLDIPDQVDETRTESLGQGDEENKYYSLGGGDNELNEGRPQP